MRRTRRSAIIRRLLHCLHLFYDCWQAMAVFGKVGDVWSRAVSGSFLRNAVLGRWRPHADAGSFDSVRLRLTPITMTGEEGRRGMTGDERWRAARCIVLSWWLSIYSCRTGLSVPQMLPRR